MNSNPSRQLLVWSVPTVAIVLSILWYRKRLRRLQTDPGGTKPDASAEKEQLVLKQNQQDKEDAEELRVVQQEYKKLLAEGLPQIEKIPETKKPAPEIKKIAPEVKKIVLEVKKIVPEVKEIIPEVNKVVLEVVAEPEVAVEKKVVVEEKVVVVHKEEVAALPESKTPAKKMKAKVATSANAVEQQVEQITELTAKISVDVQQTQQQPRDSANTSPAEAMLASPTISHDSDTHSVGSSDSGKGGSDFTTPVLEEEGGDKKARASGSRRTSTSSATASVSSVTMEGAAAEAADTEAVEEAAAVVAADQVVVYEFAIPLHLVGRLIGKHGCFVAHIKTETDSQIQVKKHPLQHKFKLCSLEGTQAEIDKALKIIRKKFPLKKYPQLTLEAVASLPLHFPLIPESLQMYLVEGINNDVVLSSLVSAGHMFLQQPTHPTFPALSRLIMTMSQCYSEEVTPSLPNPAPGVVCAAPSQGSWYRTEVIDVRTVPTEDGEATEEVVCDIKFVDYGGYMTLPASALRQIRTDFMMLPFQATECYLADVIWQDGEGCWSDDATQCVETFARDQILQAQVVAYGENSVPYIRLYSVMQIPPVMVNEVLVQEGLAKYYTC